MAPVRCAPRLLLLWVAGGVGGLGEAAGGVGKSGELFFDGGPWRIKWPRAVSCSQSRSPFLPVPALSERQRRGDDDNFGLSFISRSFFDISGGFPVFAVAGRGRFVFHLCERVEIFGCSWRRALCLRCGSSLQRWTRRPVANEAGGGGLCVFFFSSCSGRRSRSASKMCAGRPRHWLLLQFQGFEAALGGRRWTMPGSGEQRRRPGFHQRSSAGGSGPGDLCFKFDFL